MIYELDVTFEDSKVTLSFTGIIHAQLAFHCIVLPRVFPQITVTSEFQVTRCATIFCRGVFLFHMPTDMAQKFVLFKALVQTMGTRQDLPKNREFGFEFGFLNKKNFLKVNNDAHTSLFHVYGEISCSNDPLGILYSGILCRSRYT